MQDEAGVPWVVCVQDAAGTVGIGVGAGYGWCTLVIGVGSGCGASVCIGLWMA